MKILFLASSLSVLLAAHNTLALSSYVSQIPNGASVSCAACHVNPAGGGTRTAFGELFRSNSHLWSATVATPDSDGDGYSNGTELGDPTGAWRPGQPNPAGPVYNPGSATSHPGTTVTAPAITTQPVSHTVAAGATVTFTVGATGTAPLSYQWRLNGANVSGATTSALTLSAVTSANAGSYTALVSNSAGSATSAAATLTVTSTGTAPSITSQPSSQTVTAGANVTFTVVATGTAPLSYQWMKGGANISGATASALSLSSVTTADTGSYTARVSNTAGSVTSAAANLTVNSVAGTPTITSQPVSQTATVGATVSFTVGATGTAPLSYQWMKAGANISGATTSVLTLTSVTTANADSYSVRVSNTAGSATSAAATLTVNTVVASAPGTVVLGWNNLGMHCMDSGYSVFSILPPYNTIEAQLIVNGALVKSGSSYTVTYEAVADANGSINSTSQGKTDFFQYTPQLYGPVAMDLGLLGWRMPGIANVPQGMLFENNNSPAAGVSAPVNWFRAEGIPITPWDDALNKNEYPMMRLVARNSSSTVIATSDIVLPVSDEMDCRACHASGTGSARPAHGWVNDPNPERDYRLNILLLHDEMQDPATYPGILSNTGYNPQGLYQSVVANGKPVLCANCHLSEALQGSGYGNLPPLTRAIHSLHAFVTDPRTGAPLDSANNRSACYLCHPGSSTKCLRGAMGAAVAANGTMEMQCQSCHGNLSKVGDANRVGWFMEPNCQSCHSGTATSNSGQIRYTSSFDANGNERVPANRTFATTANTPASGLSLYRFSAGHGGLQCSACHGSTHAEFPTSEPNDNVRNMQLQGHAGPMIECSVCHSTVPTTSNGGPHGMHPVGQTWVGSHDNYTGSACQACHGADSRGTVLSVLQADRVLNGRSLFRGAIISCYICHNGPSGSGSPPASPTVSNVSANTAIGQPVVIRLTISGTEAYPRIISRPTYGAVALSTNASSFIATYYPDAGFSGTDAFSFAAYNGYNNSTLATGTINVGGGSGAVAPSITTQPVSQTANAGATVTFTVAATGTAPLGYQWQQDGVDIAGATNPSLTLTAVTTTSAGTYRAIVSNTAGSVTSAGATLTVSTVSAPRITTQPVSQNVRSGSSVTFSVVATGSTPLYYQWQKNGENISGATSSVLRLSSVTRYSAGTYRVVVRNSAGSVTSNGATLTVRSGDYSTSSSTSD